MEPAGRDAVVLDEAIEAQGCREERVRKLPAHLVGYLLVALCGCGGEGLDLECAMGPSGVR